MRQGCVTALFTAQHARNFFGALLRRQRGDAAEGVAGVQFFGDYQVLVGAGGNLGQVGDSQHLPVLAQQFHQASHGFGDGATDASYYTKRALLAGLYSATLLHWLGDESEHHAATWDFLDRSLQAVVKAGRSAARMGGFGKLLGMVPSPVRFARQMRRRAHGSA